MAVDPAFFAPDCYLHRTLFLCILTNLRTQFSHLQKDTGPHCM